MASHLLRTPLQFVLDGGSGPVGVVAVVDALLLHELAHGLYVVQQLVDNLAGTVRLEDAACHDAEGVDETAAELVVPHEVEQQVDDGLVIVALAADGIGTLELQEVGEGVVVVLVEVAQGEGVVEVEADKAVAPVVLAAVCLDVVVGPVVVVEKHGGGHVVGELVDVEHGLQLVVGTGIVDFAGQFEDAVQYGVVAVFHHHVFEGVEFLVVVAPVGVGEVVVIRLAHVEHAAQFAVHILDDGLV